MTPIRFHQKAFVFDQVGRFLVLKRAYTNQKWDLPGGAVELPEEHETALRREIKEETSIDVKNIVPLEIKTVLSDDGFYTIFAGFTCKAESQDVRLSPEHTEYRWATPDEFIEMDATEYLKDVARKLLNKRQG